LSCMDGDITLGTGVTRVIPSARISASRTILIYSFQSNRVSIVNKIIYHQYQED